MWACLVIYMFFNRRQEGKSGRTKTWETKLVLTEIYQVQKVIVKVLLQGDFFWSTLVQWKVIHDVQVTGVPVWSGHRMDRKLIIRWSRCKPKSSFCSLPWVWQLGIKGSEIFHQCNSCQCGLQPVHSHICLTWCEREKILTSAEEICATVPVQIHAFRIPTWTSAYSSKEHSVNWTKTFHLSSPSSVLLHFSRGAPSFPL